MSASYEGGSKNNPYVSLEQMFYNVLEGKI